jgi:hypothetical protein
MTMHYWKTFKDLTAEDILFGAKMNSGIDGSRSFIPGAYANLSEADTYAYDAWRYLEHLRQGGQTTIEEWTSNIEDDERRQMYLTLLKGVLQKKNGQYKSP